MMPDSITAAGSFARWNATDVGDKIVLLFGSFLGLLCLFDLIALGVRTMSGGRYKPFKHKRGKRAKRRVALR
jgi:hypothetical protein